MPDEMKIPSEGSHGLDISFYRPVTTKASLPEHEPISHKEGRFIPLKTTLETRAREKIGKVYVTGVPAKLASAVLK